MRELTMQEMEQVGGGFVAAAAAAACATGVVTSSYPTLAVMNCAGNVAATIAIAAIPFAGPVGAVALVGAAVGIGFATHWGNEYFEDRIDGTRPKPSS